MQVTMLHKACQHTKPFTWISYLSANPGILIICTLNRWHFILLAISGARLL
jgi:hypothetical protein